MPVATTEWFDKHPGAIFPWAREALGSQPKPTVLSFAEGLEIEKIAAQRPDLILAVYSGMTKKEYDDAVEDRPDGHRATRAGRLRLLVAGRDPHRRTGRRQAEGRGPTAT